MNLVTLIGDVSSDVTMGLTLDYKTKAEFNIRVRRPGPSSVYPVCDEFTVTCTDRQAGLANELLQKGARVAVDGCLRQTVIENGTGVIIIARRIEFLSGHKQDDE